MSNTYTITDLTNTAITNTGAVSGTYTPGTTVGGTVTLNSGIGTGGSSQIYTTNGTNGFNWATTSTQFNNSNGKPIMTVPTGKNELVLEQDATLSVKGNLVINGQDLEERLKIIERVLMIPQRDADMETKYPSLKKKFDDYINSLEKYKTFERIKGKDE